MRDRFDLIDDRFVNCWVRVADAHRQHAAEAVEILVALIVPNVTAFAAHQSQRLLVVSGDCREKKLFMFADGFGLLAFGLVLISLPSCFFEISPTSLKAPW